MKNNKIILRSISIILIGVSLFMHNIMLLINKANDTDSREWSVEEEIENRVETYAITQVNYIGNNKIKYLRVSTTNISKISDTEYEANGTVTATDVYKTQWNNKFDAKIEKIGSETWRIIDFDFVGRWY